MKIEALEAARHAGNVKNAMGHLQNKPPMEQTAHDQDLFMHLRRLLVNDVTEMSRVSVGDKLHHSSGRPRYIMTDQTLLVDIDTGVSWFPSRVPYPLEIYHYAK